MQVIVGLFFVQSTRCLQEGCVRSGQIKYLRNTSNTCHALLQEILQGREI